MWTTSVTQLEKNRTLTRCLRKNKSGLTYTPMQFTLIQNKKGPMWWIFELIKIYRRFWQMYYSTLPKIVERYITLPIIRSILSFSNTWQVFSHFIFQINLIFISNTLIIQFRKSGRKRGLWGSVLGKGNEWFALDWASKAEDCQGGHNSTGSSERSKAVLARDATKLLQVQGGMCLPADPLLRQLQRLLEVS
jgi:hypothetical protein